ncbi:MAG TPA: hypothetical protein VHJ20_20940 [Polyangia bacterium]|nr:hypothetical protein [Polyangia bacterium]
MPIEWVAEGEGSVGFVAPRGWQFEVTDEHVLAVDTGPAGTCLVEKSSRMAAPVDLGSIVGDSLGGVPGAVVVSRTVGDRHASLIARGKVDGRTVWSQSVATAQRDDDGTELISLVILQSRSKEQFDRFVEQNAADVFFTSIASPLQPPAEVFAGAWEGSAGDSWRAVLAAAAGTPLPAQAFDGGWYLRLELLDGKHYRLTRVLTRAGNARAWRAVTETGAFATSTNHLVLLREACFAEGGENGGQPRAERCGAPVATLLFLEGVMPGTVGVRGAHLLGGGDAVDVLSLARPAK